MNIWIYDIEVFKEDWVIVAKNIETKKYRIIHNDNYAVKTFLQLPDLLLGGFNNKHYDDWIIFTMEQGGTPEMVKKHNDFIIVEKKDPWTFPFIQYKKRPLYSFDLKDDTVDPTLSLKAVEGYLCRKIVESSIPFDIDRKLTKKELDEVIEYCMYDVDSSEDLFYQRKDYVDSKIMVAKMFDLNPMECVRYTNARLAAAVLEATPHKYTDEREYELPSQIDTNYIPKQILDFFMQIHDKSIPDYKLWKKNLKVIINGCPVTYAWGGFHGAKLCVKYKKRKGYILVILDVASLYPNCMINFHYISRSCRNPDKYPKIVKTRLQYKAAKKKAEAGALKLVVNVAFGGHLQKTNALYDPKMGRSICITNQLAMTELVVRILKKCNTVDLFNLNTDGIMFEIREDQINDCMDVVHTWEKKTGFTMERDDLDLMIQKDVNNYIALKSDGGLKLKGGYINRYEKPSYKSNNLRIVQRCIVDNLLYGKAVKETIQECDDIFQFQMIVKKGAYQEVVHYQNENSNIEQHVNRIYACKDKSHGEIKLRKWIKQRKIKGQIVTYDPPIFQENSVSDAPDHCMIDNENQATIDQLDLTYYERLANKRITSFKQPDPDKLKEIEKMEVITIMPETKTQIVDYSKWNVYKKLIHARVDFIKADVKKTGKNSYAEFKYFTLDDILPVANAIFEKYGLLFVTKFDNAYAWGELYNTDDETGNQCVVVSSPMRVLNTVSQAGKNKMNELQGLGAEETYQRRYLYMMILDISEGDAFDATLGKPDPDTGKSDVQKNNRPATTEQREEVKKNLIDADGKMTKVQSKSIKNGLKQLLQKDEVKYTDYANAVFEKLTSGLSKNDAEKVLIDIGNKVSE